jgi:hypothetical protein
MNDSKEQDQARLIAARIARRLTPGAAAEAQDPCASTDEATTLRASLSEMQQRLTQLEARLTHDERNTASKAMNKKFDEPATSANANSFARQSDSVASTPPANWLSGVYVPAAHPSAERFRVDEASAISELVDFFEGSKTCELEPGGKPCDHCAMCSSRGF